MIIHIEKCEECSKMTKSSELHHVQGDIDKFICDKCLEYDLRLKSLLLHTDKIQTEEELEDYRF